MNMKLGKYSIKLELTEIVTKKTHTIAPNYANVTILNTFFFSLSLVHCFVALNLESLLFFLSFFNLVTSADRYLLMSTFFGFQVIESNNSISNGDTKNSIPLEITTNFNLCFIFYFLHKEEEKKMIIIWSVCSIDFWTFDFYFIHLSVGLLIGREIRWFSNHKWK